MLSGRIFGFDTTMNVGIDFWDEIRISFGCGLGYDLRVDFRIDYRTNVRVSGSR
jgi:hypothetical protein